MSTTVAVCVTAPLVAVTTSEYGPVFGPADTVNDEAPETNDDGENVPVTPAGLALIDSDTVPAKPAVGATPSVNVAVELRRTDCVAGATVSVKSGFATTLSSTLTLRVSEPLTPVTVSANVPVGVAALVVTDTVELPEPEMVVGARAAAAPVGKPDTESVTVPAKPFSAVTIDWNDVDPPMTTACDGGVADTEKSGCGVTIKEAPTVWVSDPLTPRIVSANVPVGVVAFVEMDSTEFPVPVIDAGANMAVAPEGRPETDNATEPVNPFVVIELTWNEAVLPTTTLCDGGVDPNAKSGCATGARTTSSNLVTVGSAGLASSWSVKVSTKV